MDYLELITKFENNKRIPYVKLLETSEWKIRRSSILQRDKYCCTNCGKKQSMYHMNFNIACVLFVNVLCNIFQSINDHDTEGYKFSHGFIRR